MVAAGGAGYWAGEGGFLRSFVMALHPVVQPAVAAAPATAAIIYYRDPDAPAYSSDPARNPAGKEFIAVRASEDVSFDTPVKPVVDAPASESRRIRFYRNPMGLPDTSPTPQNDSMGMDYR